MSFWPIPEDSAAGANAGLRSLEELEHIPRGQWDSLEWLFYELKQDIDQGEQSGLWHNIRECSRDLGAWIWENDQVLDQLTAGDTTPVEDIIRDTKAQLKLCRLIARAKEKVRKWHLEKHGPFIDPGRDEPFPDIFWLPGFLQASVSIWNCTTGEAIRNVQAVDLKAGVVYHLGKPPFPGYEWELGRARVKKSKYPYDVVDYQPEGGWPKEVRKFKIFQTQGEFRVAWATAHGDAPSKQMEAVARLLNFDTSRGKFHENILGLHEDTRGEAIIRFLYEQAPNISDSAY